MTFSTWGPLFLVCKMINCWSTLCPGTERCHPQEGNVFKEGVTGWSWRVLTAETPQIELATKKTVSWTTWNKQLKRLVFVPKQLWSWMGFWILPTNRLCSIIMSCFRLGFRGLSPYSFGILFHHHFLVPARVPGILFWHSVPSSVPGSG